VAASSAKEIPHRPVDFLAISDLRRCSLFGDRFDLCSVQTTNKTSNMVEAAMLGTRTQRAGKGTGLLIVSILAIIVVALLLFKSEVFRTGMQVPVSVSL
jgi:hypothetical protein